MSASMAGFAVGKNRPGFEGRSRGSDKSQADQNGPRGTEVALVKFIPSAIPFF